jgi:predicted ATPase/class 3 adenylate cyclase
VVVPTGSGGWYPRSFVLTDIVGSVSLWERDADLMAQAVARHDAIIGREVAGVGGTVVRSKGEGDSTFSVFDHPADAVAAAAAIQAAIGAEPWPAALPLLLRAGVHTGDAEPRNGDWYGPAVNRAARLRALAYGHQTLLSGVTAGLVADRLPHGVRLLYRGRRVLRGIERPEEVWELVSADDPRLTLSAGSATGLPVPSTLLIGRRADVDELRRLVGAERLVTLTGPGGSGKTRLALEVARHSERQGEMVWLAELALLSDPDSVPNMVAAAVGLQLETGDARGALLAGSAGLAGLLVLDNCEHVLVACAELAGPLLATAPDLRTLATSREALELDGERTWPVQPLAVPGESVRGHDELMRIESVALLIDRVRAIRPDLEIGDDDLTAVRGISRCLDGLPLAIELAAGRLRSMSLHDLAAHLDEHVLDLTRGRWSTGRTPRHRSLQLALDWSYDLLSESQRTLARRLAVFAGGFRLDAVEATCGRDLDVLDTVDELVAKSMVTFDVITARYRLLEPIRQYLAERLEESDESEVVRRAHIAWTAALCEEVGGRLLVDQRARSIRLREESGNVEAALTRALHHCEHDMVLRMVGSLGLYWLSNEQASGRRWCAEGIRVSGDAAPRLRADVLLSAGMVAQNDREWNKSIACLRESLAIYRRERVIDRETSTLVWLGRALLFRWETSALAADANEATDCFRQGLRLAAEVSDVISANWCRVYLSQQAVWSGDLDAARHLSWQAVRECKAARVGHPVAAALRNLALVADRQGHRDEALDHLRNAVALGRDLNDRVQLCISLAHLAAHPAIDGRGPESLHTLTESAQVQESIGGTGRVLTLAVAATVHLACNRPELATASLAGFDAQHVRRHPEPWVADALEFARARLDPVAVADATTRAGLASVDDLIGELVLRPANVH